MLFLHREDLDPVVVRVMDEVEAHLVVLKADAPHLAVVFSDLVVVALHTHAEMRLVVAELIRALMVAEPGQLQPEGFVGAGEVGDDEVSLRMPDLADLFEAEGLAVEVDRPLQVGHVDVHVVEMGFDFHGCLYLKEEKLKLFACPKILVIDYNNGFRNFD